MKKFIATFVVTLALTPRSSAQDTLNRPPDYYGDALRESYGFWKNTGWVRATNGTIPTNIEYVTDGGSPRAFIKRGGEFSLTLASIDTSTSTLDTLRRLDVEFDGPGALHPDPIVRELRGYHKNFHLPWCGPGGKTGVPGYTWMMYPNIYPKIDMYMYCGSRGQKLMFVIRPEGDPAKLKMTFSGQNEMDLDVFGNLKLLLQDRWIVLPQAIAYQYDEQNNIHDVNWMAEYTANSSTGEVGFTFDQYNRYLPLVLLIGPPPMMGGPSVFTNGVCWSTFYGGDGEDVIRASRIDSQGNYYVTGQTFSSETTFPVEDGQVIVAVQPAVTVGQFNNTDHLNWSTLFGATDDEQIAFGVAIPPLGGGVYIGGLMGGDDIATPVEQPPGRYVNTTPAGGDQGFLASFSTANGTLMWSTYFGQTFSAVHDLDFDALGNMFLCGQMGAGLPLPTEVTPDPSAASWPYGGGSFDAFVTKLNQSGKVAWSTYIGGSGLETARSIRMGAGGVVLAGRTQSSNVQTLSAGGSQAHNFSTTSYGADTFLEEFNTLGIHLWGSYLSYGGEMGFKGLAVDRNNGDIFLAGWFPAANATMPVSTNAPWYQQALPNNSEKAFIWQIGSDHVRKYSTFINGGGGASGSNELYTIVVLNDGTFFAAGTAWGTGIPTQPAGDLYYETDRLGMGDGYIIGFTPWHARSWCTYFGGNLDFGSHPDRITTLAAKGITRLYAAGYTSSPYDEDLERFFPLHDELGGAWWDSFIDLTNGGSDGFTAAFCIEGNVVGIEPTPIDAATLDCQVVNGTVVIHGLSAGIHMVTLVDQAGRAVAVQTVLSSAAQVGLMSLPPLAEGIYVLSAAGRATRLFIGR